MEALTLESLWKQPYERRFEIREEGGQRYFLYRLVDIPEIMGEGATKSEALAHLRECFDDYMTWRLEESLPITPPSRRVRLDSRPRTQACEFVTIKARTGGRSGVRVASPQPQAEARAETAFGRYVTAAAAAR